MATKPVSFSLPLELIEAFGEYCSSSGLGKSDVIKILLSTLTTGELAINMTGPNPKVVCFQEEEPPAPPNTVEEVEPQPPAVVPIHSQAFTNLLSQLVVAVGNRATHTLALANGSLALDSFLHVETDDLQHILANLINAGLTTKNAELDNPASCDSLLDGAAKQLD